MVNLILIHTMNKNMKIKDARGLELLEDFNKVTIGGPIVVDENGNEESNYADLVLYVKSDKMDEFVKLKDHIVFEFHGYRESIK